VRFRAELAHAVAEQHRCVAETAAHYRRLTATDPNARMQPKLNTAVERVDLFNLHPRVAISLHYIPTAVVEMSRVAGGTSSAMATLSSRFSGAPPMLCLEFLCRCKYCPEVEFFAAQGGEVLLHHVGCHLGQGGR